VSSEQLLNILLEGDDIERCSARRDIDEEIDVAVLVIVTARNQAKQEAAGVGLPHRRILE
jgi:hypothetical protein